MRILSILAAIAIFASPAIADNHVKITKVATVPSAERLPGHEPDTYRFGYPYAAMRGTSPGQCEMMCNRDDSCSAWSYLPATFQMGPRCELKQSVGSQSYRPGAVSGIASKYHPVPRTTIQPKATHPATRPAPRTVTRPAPPPIRTTRAAPQPAPTRPAQQPYQMRELLGGPTTVSSGQTAMGRVTRPAAVEPRPVPAPTVYPQPAPAPQQAAAAPRPLTQAPNAVMRRPAPVSAAQPTRQAPPPARPVPQFQMVPPEETASAQSAPVATAPVSSGGVSITPAAPIPNRRKPWTERSNGDPDYSVGDSGFIPGDEEATAGFIDGLPEADDE